MISDICIPFRKGNANVLFKFSVNFFIIQYLAFFATFFFTSNEHILAHSYFVLSECKHFYLVLYRELGTSWNFAVITFWLTR